VLRSTLEKPARLRADLAHQAQVTFTRQRRGRVRLEQRQIGGRALERDITARAVVAADVDALRHVHVDVPDVGLTIQFRRDVEPQHQRPGSQERHYPILVIAV
jgi:hypothetical protein